MLNRYKAHDSHLFSVAFLSTTEWSQAAGTGLNRPHIWTKSDKDALIHWIVIWEKLDYMINQSMGCRWLMTDFLSVCALGCSMGSCPRNGLDLLIYSACVSWPSSHWAHPMTKCVFHFKCSLVALRLNNGSFPTHTHTQTQRCRKIQR